VSHELTFLPEPGVLRQVREDVRQAAAKLGAEERVCDTAALVVDELVNNAIEHGVAYRRHGHELEVRVLPASSGIELVFHDPEMPAQEVTDLAAALAVANDMPSLENERGRGLFLMSIYLSGLKVEADSRGGMSLRGVIENA